jgi:hypothetical protein
MKNWIRTTGLTLLALVAICFAASPALADGWSHRGRDRDPSRDRDWRDWDRDWDRDDNDHERGDRDRGRRQRRRAAPEIDPMGAGSAVALLAGGGALLRSRRSTRSRES